MPLAAVLLLMFAGALLAGCGGPADPGTGSASGDSQAGQQLAEARNCLVCHSVDGRPGLGPTWQGLWGSEVELTDGSTVVVDEAYVAEAVRDPQASSRADFAGGGMPAADLSDEELADLAAYLQDLQDEPAP